MTDLTNCEGPHGFPETGRQTMSIHDRVGRLLTVKEAAKEIGLSRAMIYRLMNARINPFPQPMKFGMASRWSLVEIVEWKARARSLRDRQNNDD